VSAIQTPEDRFLNDTWFHQTVNLMVYLYLQRDWRTKDFMDAMQLAEEQGATERLKRMSREGSGQ
jgi:hypothetical protein